MNNLGFTGQLNGKNIFNAIRSKAMEFAQRIAFAQPRMAMAA